MLVKGGLIGAGTGFFHAHGTISAALFFILLSAFQFLWLSLRRNGTTMVLGIFATLLLTLPVTVYGFHSKTGNLK